MIFQLEHQQNNSQMKHKFTTENITKDRANFGEKETETDEVNIEQRIWFCERRLNNHLIL